MKEKVKELTELVRTLREEIAVYKEHYKDAFVSPQQLNSLYAELASVQKAYLDAERNNTMYRQWFARNAHWTQRHNNMFKYDPHLGNYDMKGADEEIIIPPVEQFTIVKGTSRLSPVAEDTQEE